MSRLLALPPELLEAVVSLVPEAGDDQEEDEHSYSCAGAGFRLATSGRPEVEATCRALRSAALALPPARLWLQFDHTQPDGGVDVPALLRGLRRRPPAVNVEVAELPAGIEPAAWEPLAAPLLGGARQLLVRGGESGPLRGGEYEQPAVLPPGLLALTAASGIQLDIYPAWQEDTLPGFDSLPRVEDIRAEATTDAPEIWRCRNLRSLTFNNGVVVLPPGAQPAAYLTRLASLSLGGVTFPDGQLPPELCTLPSLKSLDIHQSRAGELVLPPQASRLAAVGRLVCRNLSTSLDGGSRAALAWMPALARLHLHGAAGLGRVAGRASSAVCCCSTPSRARARPRSACLPAECALQALPAGPRQSTLRDLALLGSGTVAGEELPPPSIAGASQLTALRCSLHTLSLAALHEWWPALVSTLQSLPHLKVRVGGGDVAAAWQRM